ncbi:transporter [Streptomyces sp. H10-C2]|uniref:transporter n=1 Tax=unclassified Streptomyces TaxID=2593676 RepID=UPI0024B8DE66|nr:MULTISPECIES: transporter [unclassified Streptomyces]MDJ0342476.1 transporter [Streptomyces sp. PH10-H1]MDJ0372331.1 transporter [Streptomyces sp. H10-C2]
MSAPSVTPVFIRLKLSIVRNGLRQSTGRTIGWIVGVVFAMLYGIGMGVGMIALRDSQYAPAAAVGLAVVLILGWAVMPLFLFGGDDTLDPTRLAMLPLRPRPLIAALLVSSLLGVGPVFTIIVTAGAVAALAGNAASLVVSVVAVALVLLLCVALSRAVAAANTRLLTSRKGRDLALLSGLFVAVGAQLVNLGASSLASSDGLARVKSIASVLRWLPPAPAIDAVRAAAEGSYGLAVLELGYVAAVLALVIRWWHHSLYRLMVSPDASTLQAAEKEAGSGGGRLAALLPAGRAGTVMERQFRYAWRDPRSKAAWATALAVGLLLPIVAAVQHGSIYSACWAAGLLGMQMYNQFGVDGSAFWTVASTISTRADAHAELRARALALSTVAVPYVTVVTIGASLLLGRPDAIPETLGLSFALLGALIAAGAFASVRFPYALPQDNPFGSSAPGQGGLAAISLFGGGLTGAACCLPLVGLTVYLHVADHHAYLWLLLPAGALYAIALSAASLHLTAPRLLNRLPEILSAVAKG